MSERVNAEREVQVADTWSGDSETSSVAEFNRMWAQFQGIMRQMTEKLADNLAISFGADLRALPSAEERRSVFGGTSPTARTVAEKLARGQYRNVVVCCGAGISTSAGIPDFRSPDTGVYAQLKREQERKSVTTNRSSSWGGDAILTSAASVSDHDDAVALDSLPSPEALFSIEFYKQNQLPFIIRAGHLWPGADCKYRPTPSHCFLRLIAAYVRRVYTQNIDELETWSSLLPRDKVRRCHGSFEEVHCTVWQEARYTSCYK